MNLVTYILGELFTLLNYALNWKSIFSEKKKNILLWENLARVSAIIAFFLLGTYDGIKSTVFGFFRNYFAIFVNEKSKKAKIGVCIFLEITLVLMYSINFKGISTIVIAIAGMINIFGVIVLKEQGLRIAKMFASAFYAIFLISTFNIVGAICELIGFTMIVLSYLKYRKIDKVKERLKKRKNKEV